MGEPLSGFNNCLLGAIDGLTIDWVTTFEGLTIVYLGLYDGLKIDCVNPYVV